jgi:hemerythrin-like domain-containing protein
MLTVIRTHSHFKLEVFITDAIKYVQGKMDHLNGEEKRLLQDIKQDFNSLPQSELELKDGDGEEQEQEQKTTNGVF